MELVGVFLIVGVAGLYLLWLRFQRQQEAAVVSSSGKQELTVVVKAAYSPNVITVKRGVAVKLHFDRQEDASCSRFVSFPKLKIHRELPSFAITDVEFTPTEAGEIPFTCDMGMYQGRVIVEA